MPYEPKGGFGFVATSMHVVADLPYNITEKVKLDRPNAEQLNAIQKTLDEAGSLGLPGRIHYEYRWIPEKDGTTTGEVMKREDWKYYIITYEGRYSDYRLLKIASLIEPFIICFSQFSTSEPFGRGSIIATTSDPVGMHIFYNSIIEEYPFDDVSGDTLRRTITQFLRLDAVKHEGIMRAVDAHYEIRRFDRMSRLAVLAQFSIIEMLLTHNPNDKEIGDSLSHQLRTKTALLNGRMSIGFDYSLFPNAPNHDKLWTALYAYRSALAHGGHIDFNAKSLRPLVNDQKVRGFMDSATRLIIRYALEEPDLVNALKPI